MVLAARQLFAIARTTWLEAIQQPVAFLMVLSSLLMTLLVPIFQFHRFGEEGRLARDSGLSCLLLFGLVLAVGTAGRSVAGEIASGTAAAVIGKPVSRAIFLIGKWLGVSGVVAFFSVGQVAATLLAERCSAHLVVREDFAGQLSDPITLLLALAGVALALLIAASLHFIKHKRFGVSVFVGLVVGQAAVVVLSHWTNTLAPLNFRAVPAALLVLAALAVFASLATALATRLQTGATLVLCGGILLLGLAGDTLFADAAGLSPRGAASGILPDLQNFWLCDAVARGGRIESRYLWEACLYAATCCALFLMLGCALFRTRDLG